MFLDICNEGDIKRLFRRFRVHSAEM